MQDEQTLRIRTSTLRKLKDDYVETAKAVNLRYTTDSDPGIYRTGKGEAFVYVYKEKEITDEETLSRIKRLAIPPAWTDVWICDLPTGHLQATGLDARNRKQYRYHSLWNALRNFTKFSHLYDFGVALPAIRQQLEKDMALTGMPQQKVLATIISLMQNTNIRIGNNVYEKLYGSFGLTTLKNKHVKIEGSELKFFFKGKKGVHHDIKLHSRKLAKIVRQCREIPGKELFQYYDENNEIRTVDSGMVNDYLRNVCDDHFTSKDFRTWSGTVYALEKFIETGYCETEAEAKKRVAVVLDTVAKKLGNTSAVCRKYYVHPFIIEQYLDKNLEKYFPKSIEIKNPDSWTKLTAGEKALMNMLENKKTAEIAA